MSATRICATWILAAAMTGCAATAGHWSDPGDWSHDAYLPDEQELTDARHAYINADNAAALRSAIATMEDLLANSPGLESLRVDLAEAYTLLGAAYENSRRHKRDHFQTAQHHAERVLLSRPGFRQALEGGQRPGLAARQLTGEDVPAMVIWATATAYLFDEGLSSMGRVRHYRGLEDLRLFMERAYELEPEYEYGLVPFSLAIFYIATPQFAGGDLDRAARLMANAIETPGNSLMPRWGRARYLHTLTGDRQAKRSDLEWVLAQDARAADSPYPWNIYVQQDARRMLAELDRE
jgi:hypothetical protein